MKKFIFLLFTFLVVGQFVGSLIGYALGSDNLRISLFLSQLLGFLLAAVLAERFALGRGISFFDLRPVSGKTILYAVLTILASMPFIFLLYQLNRMLPMPEFMLEMEKEMNEIVKILLANQSPLYLVLNVLLMAVVPGICEEVFFRGGLQKGLTLNGLAPWTAILVTAFIFSAIHLQFQGFFPRFFLGIAFGYLYYLSGSLWVPIICHTIFNGSQVLAAALYPEEVMETPDIPLDIQTVGLVVAFSALSYFLFTLFKKSCTPPQSTV